MKKCADCKAGEHDDYDNDIKLVAVRDPELNQLVKRAYLCSQHRTMYEMDGYRIYET